MSDLRGGDRLIRDLPLAGDAHLHFLGVIRTPFRTLQACPKQGDPQSGPRCEVQVDPVWRLALSGLAVGDWVQLAYWLHLSRRDLAMQDPRRDGTARGTFSLRSPQRPNPIGLSTAHILEVTETGLAVRGLDCLDGTPLLDIKPTRCPEAP